MTNGLVTRIAKVTYCITFFSLVLAGCSSAQKTSPHLGFSNFGMEAELGRDDVVVLDRVEGTSTSTRILGGLIEIVDGDKLSVLGIKFFKDKYTFVPNALGPDRWWATTASRAYYQALEKAPEADAVFFKAQDNEDEGIPLIFDTKTVTWKGKAVKLKSDS